MRCVLNLNLHKRSNYIPAQRYFRPIGLNNEFPIAGQYPLKQIRLFEPIMMLADTSKRLDTMSVKKPSLLSCSL